MSVNKTSAGNPTRFWTTARLALTIVTLSLIAAFGISSCNSTDKTTTTTPTAKSPATAKNNPFAPAPLTSLPSNVRDTELRAVNGQPIKLSNYSGKVLLVNLWATWCGPCRIETPELVKLHQEFESQGVEMVGLSTENPDASEDSVREFVHDYNVNYRIGWATPDVARTLMQGRDAIPQSFIISRDGRIIKRFVGFNPTTTPPEMKQAIEAALNNKQS
jgi:glutathione peroxidase-family protein